jgi:acetyl esterase/lipase
MSWGLVVVAAGLLAAARFAFWPARTRRMWLVALAATELGHVWALVALGTSLAGAVAGDVAGWLAAGLAGLAAAGFARPAWCAWRMSNGVERDLARVFGAGGGLWSWRRLWRGPGRTRRVAVERFEAEGRAVDFYRAEGASGSGGAPCVVLVHGGGWDGGDRGELATFNHWLAASGVAVAAFDYRLAPEFRWPAQKEDTRVVVNWIRANAAELGVDGERLTLVGRSAGAQIAVATAFGEALPGVRAVVALYGVHNLEFVWSIRSERDALNSDKLMRQYLGGGPEEGLGEAYREGSGELLAHGGVPPTLIVHGVLDELVWCRHSEKLAAALEGAGAPHVLVRMPWATHAGEANLHGPAGQLITGAVLRAAAGNGGRDDQ